MSEAIWYIIFVGLPITVLGYGSYRVWQQNRNKIIDINDLRDGVKISPRDIVVFIGLLFAGGFLSLIITKGLIQLLLVWEWFDLFEKVIDNEEMIGIFLYLGYIFMLFWVDGYLVRRKQKNERVKQMESHIIKLEKEVEETKKYPPEVEKEISQIKSMGAKNQKAI